MRIILADDHKLMLEGLVALLSQNAQIEIVAIATTGLEAVGLAQKHDPDILILDISMPDISGIEVTRRISATCPFVKIVILSMHKERRFVEEALKAGAISYLLKECAFDEILLALDSAKDNRLYLSKQINEIMIRDFIYSSPAKNMSLALLTAREREILQYIVEGKSTSQIAQILFVSNKTIESHRRNLMMKLKLKTVAELTRYAIRVGIIQA